MYGLLLKNLQDFIVDKWGQKKWEAVKEALKLSEVTLCGSYYSVDGQLFYRNHTLCDKALRYKSS